jgi:DNA-binding SARP family transcriptional activator
VITFRVLGPLAAEDARGQVDLKGPRHRAVLARLLIARGRVVPVNRLVTDLWEDPPAGAVGAVQTFVAALRKALEPDRPPRTPACVLVTSGPGYALRAEAVDAWQFEEALSAGRIDEAIGLWRGPAYAEFADEPWARGEIARLDELWLLALERRASALLSAGRAAEAVPDLEAHVESHPWREDAWRLLALAHYRAGRQGDALATVRRAKELLATELGVDPGPNLRQLEADILAHAPTLIATPDSPVSTLVGRDTELARLFALAEAVKARGRLGLVLLAGEAGAGKTALAEAVTANLSGRGWTTAWGSNPDDEGLPAAWPWAQILAALPAPTFGSAPANTLDLASGPGSARSPGPMPGSLPDHTVDLASGTGHGRSPCLAPGSLPGDTFDLASGAGPGQARGLTPGSVPDHTPDLASRPKPGRSPDLVPGSLLDDTFDLVPGTGPGQSPGLVPGSLPGDTFDLVSGPGPGRSPGLVPGSVPGDTFDLASRPGPAQAPGRAVGSVPDVPPGSALGRTSGPGSVAAPGPMPAPDADTGSDITPGRALGPAPASGPTSGPNPGPESSPGAGSVPAAMRRRADSATGPIPAFAGPMLGSEAVPGAASPHISMPEPDLTGDPAVARFHWYRAVAARLARHAPLLLVLDDLHWAGEETLALLASLVAEPPPGAILVIATYRTTDVPARLAGFLGRVARAEPIRVYLGGLSPDAVRDLVRTMTGDDTDATAIHRRSGGNPFFVRELARLVADGGDLSDVPAGVRDVVRYRVATLPDAVQSVLRHAAVLGPDIDLDLLPGDDVLDALEIATERGFLVEHGPGRFRFAHALVKDTLYQDLSHSRRVRWHAAVAERVERHRPHDVEALAHHYMHAENLAKGVPYARAAAEQAERRFASHQAARLWRVVLDHTDDPRERLTSIMGLVRALAVTGGLAPARQYRAEALTLAETVADPALTAQVIAAFDVPAVWTENDDPPLAQRIVEVTERTLAAVTEPAVRSRLLSTVALELRNTGGARAQAAAVEAEAIAREVGDPAVLAFALNARFMQSFERAGLAPRRAAIGRELVDLAVKHGMVTFEVLGHLILVQANSALADFDTADRHAAAADQLGKDYKIPLVSVVTDWYRAMRATVAGEPAEALYRAAAARLAGTGMTGMSHGLLDLALLCDRVQRNSFGGYESWPNPPRDLLFEARTCLNAITAIQRGDRETMARLYTELEPAAAELAGAGSGVLTLRPVAHYLADLATALGRDAADHRRQATEVAKRAGAPQWIH